MRLSLDRANAVREHLISRGIDPAHLRAVGRGEQEPLVSNDSAEGRANNRRVVLVIQNNPRGESERRPRAHRSGKEHPRARNALRANDAGKSPRRCRTGRGGIATALRDEPACNAAERGWHAHC